MLECFGCPCEACVVGRQRDLLALAAEVLDRAQVQCVERADDERKGLECPLRGEWMQFDHAEPCEDVTGGLGVAGPKATRMEVHPRLEVCQAAGDKRLAPQ